MKHKLHYPYEATLALYPARLSCLALPTTPARVPRRHRQAASSPVLPPAKYRLLRPMILPPGPSPDIVGARSAVTSRPVDRSNPLTVPLLPVRRLPDSEAARARTIPPPFPPLDPFLPFPRRRAEAGRCRRARLHRGGGRGCAGIPEPGGQALRLSGEQQGWHRGPLLTRPARCAVATPRHISTAARETVCGAISPGGRVRACEPAFGAGGPVGIPSKTKTGHLARHSPLGPSGATRRRDVPRRTAERVATVKEAASRRRWTGARPFSQRRAAGSGGI